MVDRSRRSVGATIAAARGSAGRGRRREPRRRHPPRGGGTRQRLLRLQRRRRRGAPAAVRRRRCASRSIDLDVHQGDGTAAIFAGDASVFTMSLHGAKNFPFRKAASDLDIALPDGCADAEYLAALDDALEALGARARASAVRPRVLSGRRRSARGRSARAAEGQCRGSARSATAASSMRCARGAIPVALAMAGGYGRDLDVTVAIQAATIAAAHRRLAGVARRCRRDRAARPGAVGAATDNRAP